MFIWLDLETTGLTPDEDSILSMGLLVTDDNFKELGRAEWVVGYDTKWLLMAPVVQEMHTKSGLLDRVAKSTLTLIDICKAADRFLLNIIGEPAESVKDRPPMAGSSVYFDRAFLEVNMPVLLRHFNYRLLDVTSFKVLAMATVPGAKEWNAAQPDPKHTVISDIEGSIAELKHWMNVFSGLFLGCPPRLTKAFPSAEVLAEMEGDAVPMACSPRLVNFTKNNKEEK